MDQSSCQYAHLSVYHVYSFVGLKCSIKPFDARSPGIQPIMLAPLCTRGDIAVNAAPHSLLDLPPELWIAILRFTDTRTILRCTAVGLLSIFRTTRY